MSLAKKTISGVAWTIATNLGSRAIGLVGTLLLARYIDPGDYGEVMAATVIATTAQAFSNVGIGQYLVVRPKESARAAFHVTVYGAILTGTAVLIALALGPVLGPFFKVKNLMRYLPILLVLTFVDRISSVPERLLFRDMRFKLIGINNAIGDLLYTGVSLALVKATGGMSIVWANLARCFWRAGVIFAAQGRKDWLEPTPLRKDVTRALFAFGLPMSAASWAGFAARRWDNMIMSHYFGPAVMGAYNYAYNLAAVPATQVGEQIGDVLLTSFAHLEESKRRDSFVRAMSLLSLIMFPLCAGLGAVAETLVNVAFNKRWELMAPMLTWLSVVSYSSAISYSTGCYLQVLHRTGTISVLDIGRVGLMVLSLVVLCRLGPMGACVAVALTFSIHALASFGAVAVYDRIKLSRILGALLPPLLSCVPMVAAVLAVRRGLGLNNVAGLVLEVLAGGLGYVGGALLIARRTSRDFIQLAQGFIRRRRGTPADGVPPSEPSGASGASP